MPIKYTYVTNFPNYEGNFNQNRYIYYEGRRVDEGAHVILLHSAEPRSWFTVSIVSLHGQSAQKVTNTN